MNKKYPFQLWLTNTLVPPIVAFIYVFLVYDQPNDGLRAAIPLALFGATLSLQALGLNTLICRRLANSSMSTFKAKGYIMLLGVALIAISFWGVYLWYGEFEKVLLLLPAGYILVSIVAVSIFHLRVPGQNDFLGHCNSDVPASK